MLKFAKGSSASSKGAVRTPDSITTNDTVEFLLGISEGPIKGLVNGPKTFYLQNTALLSVDDTPNFASFALQFWPGTEIGHTVTMELGGFGNPIAVGTTLAQNTAVTRSGTTHGIDAADFRILIQSLVKQTDTGTFTAPLSLKFEIKRATDATWQPAWISDISTVTTPPAPATDAYWQSFGDSNFANSYSFANDVVAYTASAAPTAPPAKVGTVFVYDTGSSTLYSWRDNAPTWTPEVRTPGAGFEVLADGRRLYSTIYGMSGAREGDLWKKSDTELLVWGNGVWAVGGTLVPLATPTGPSDGIWTVDAKVSSATAKDFRVFLPPTEATTWQFRVTKLSQDDDTQISSVVIWESIQEIKRRPWTFHALSMVRLIGQASDQFTSLPNLEGDYDGRIVKVPSNYNPDTRIYTGIWDGTYQIKWTNNPAWIFQDFVENERYGLSSVFLHTANKWRIYEWAQHCDVSVSRPDGSTRPRWTYNDYVQEPRDAKEMAQYIAGSAGALYVDDGNGVVDVMIDRDETPIMIFTPENISEDGFAYSYTDRLTRSNEIIGEFVNPNLDWQADKRVLRDEADIAAYGRISENFIAVGCTDEDELNARMRRRLIGGLTEKELVNFTTNRQGKYLSEWDVILIADPQMGRGLTGRIKDQLSSTSFSLRDPITLDSGITYTATFTVTNPNYPTSSSEPYTTVRRTISSAAGTHTSLNFSAALPDLAGHAPFGIEAVGYVGVPKPYRIVGIDDDAGVGEIIKITALELNRNKYTYIDTGVDLGTIDYGNQNKTVAPATNLRVGTSVRQKGLVSTRVATLRWARSVTTTVRKYTVVHTLNGVPSDTPGDVTDNVCEFEGVGDGEHIFTVTAVDIFGRPSVPAVVRYDTRGITPISGQFNFRLDGGGTIFETIEPTFLWDAIQLLPNFDHYEILILHPTLDVPLRVENVGVALTWSYKFALNQADHAGIAPRNLRIGLRAVDQFGNSSAPDQLTVTNPAPAAPTGVTAVVDGDGLLVSWNAPLGTKDFGGTKVLVAPTIHPTTVVFNGTGTQARFPASATGDYFIKVGHYDLYVPTEVVYGTEFSVGITSLVADALAAFDAQTAAVTALQLEVAGIVDGSESVAESLIQARLATVDEIRAREGDFTGLTNTTETLQTAHESLVENVVQLTAETGVNFAIVNTTLTTTTNLASASANELHFLGAVNGTNTGFIIDQAHTYVDATTSLGSRLSLIENRFGGSASSFLLTNINTAVSNASAAITRTNLMGAANGTNTGFILDTSKVFIGSDGTSLATYIQGLSVSSSTASAIADSRISVQLGSGGSIASSLTAVTTTANNASASASIALNTANGDTASVAVLTRVGGRITGFRVNGTNGDFVIEASKFIIVDSSGASAVIPFSIVSGLATFANPITIVAGAVKVIMGPGFGASSDLLIWFGSTTTAIGACTRGNANFALCTDGAVVVPTSGGGGVLTVSASPAYANWSDYLTTPGVQTAPGTHTFTGPAPTVSVSGGSGSYRFAWTVDAGITVDNPNGMGTTFSRYIGFGDNFNGTARCTVQDTVTGALGWVDVPVGFSETH